MRIEYRKFGLGLVVSLLMMASVALAMDLTGTGQNCPTVYDSRNGMWYSYVTQSGVSLKDAKAGENATMQTVQFGGPEFEALTGDLDGDGIDDYIVFNNGQWYAYSAAQNIILKWNENWGYNGCIPYTGKFNSDDVDDISVWDPVSYQWYFKYSTETNETKGSDTYAINLHWAAPDEVFTADTDGDGQTEIGFRINFEVNFQYGIRGEGDANNYGSCNAQVLFNITLDGYPTLVCRDYNHDGKIDIAGYNTKNGLWEIFYVTSDPDDPIVTTTKQEIQWGFSGCIPVPDDYNGDGYIDLAVYDPVKSDWWIAYWNGAGCTGTDKVQWGYPEVVPVD